MLEFNRGHVEYIIATDEALSAAADGGVGGAAAAALDGEEDGDVISKKQKGKKTITKDKE